MSTEFQIFVAVVVVVIFCLFLYQSIGPSTTAANVTITTTAASVAVPSASSSNTPPSASSSNTPPSAQGTGVQGNIIGSPPASSSAQQMGGQSVVVGSPPPSIEVENTLPDYSSQTTSSTPAVPRYPNNSSAIPQQQRPDPDNKMTLLPSVGIYSIQPTLTVKTGVPFGPMNTAIGTDKVVMILATEDQDHFLAFITEDSRNDPDPIACWSIEVDTTRGALRLRDQTGQIIGVHGPWLGRQNYQERSELVITAKGNEIFWSTAAGQRIGLPIFTAPIPSKQLVPGEIHWNTISTSFKSSQSDVVVCPGAYDLMFTQGLLLMVPHDSPQGMFGAIWSSLTPNGFQLTVDRPNNRLYIVDVDGLLLWESPRAPVDTRAAVRMLVNTKGIVAVDATGKETVLLDANNLPTPAGLITWPTQTSKGAWVVCPQTEMYFQQDGLLCAYKKTAKGALKNVFVSGASGTSLQVDRYLRRFIISDENGVVWQSKPLDSERVPDPLDLVLTNAGIVAVRKGTSVPIGGMCLEFHDAYDDVNLIPWVSGDYKPGSQQLSMVNSDGIFLQYTQEGRLVANAKSPYSGKRKQILATEPGLLYISHSFDTRQGMMVGQVGYDARMLKMFPVPRYEYRLTPAGITVSDTVSEKITIPFAYPAELFNELGWPSITERPTSSDLVLTNSTSAKRLVFTKSGHVYFSDAVSGNILVRWNTEPTPIDRVVIDRTLGTISLRNASDQEVRRCAPNPPLPKRAYTFVFKDTGLFVCNPVNYQDLATLVLSDPA